MPPWKRSSGPSPSFARVSFSSRFPRRSPVSSAGSAARQARIAGLLGQRQHRNVRPLPLPLLEFQFGLGDAEQQVAGQRIVGQHFGRRGWSVGAFRRLGGGIASGGRHGSAGRLGRCRFLRRGGARGQHGGEGYNGESVFQGKILVSNGQQRSATVNKFALILRATH